MDANNNYDIENRKLTNVGEGTASSDAITKRQFDTAMTDKHDNNQNIDLKGTYNVINSKQQTFGEMNASRNTLVCYEDVRDVFVSRKESVLPMATLLDMGNQFMYNVKTPIVVGIYGLWLISRQLRNFWLTLKSPSFFP